MLLSKCYDAELDVLAIKDSESHLSLSAESIKKSCAVCEISMTEFGINFHLMHYKPTGELVMMFISNYSKISDNHTNNDIVAWWAEAQWRIKQIFNSKK